LFFLLSLPDEKNTHKCHVAWFFLLELLYYRWLIDSILSLLLFSLIPIFEKSTFNNCDLNSFGLKVQQYSIFLFSSKTYIEFDIDTPKERKHIVETDLIWVNWVDRNNKRQTRTNVQSCRDICRASSGLLGTTAVMCRGKGSRTSRREKCNSCHHITPVISRWFTVRQRDTSARVFGRVYLHCVCSRNYYDRIPLLCIPRFNEYSALSKRYGCLEYNAFVCNAVKRKQAETDQNSWRNARYKYTVFE